MTRWLRARTLAELEPTDRDAIEDHVFACDVCFARLRAAERLHDGLRTLASAKPPTTLTTATLAEMKQAGRRIEEFRVGPHERLQGSIGVEAEIAVLRVRVDLRDVVRAELRLCRPDGTAFLVVPAPFEPDSGELLVACDARVAASYETLRFQIVAVEPADRGTIADVTFVQVER